MAPGGRRHTSGLRREEVAVLAGVSASWYTWLEQGRDIKVSDGVLEAISDALILDETERSHLFLLAGLNPPAAALRASPKEIARIKLIADRYHPLPAFAVDRYWNNLAINEAAAKLLGLHDERSNHLVTFFTDRSVRERYVNWGEIAVRLVGQFRVQSARFPDDASFERMTRSLCAASPEFTELWSQHSIENSAMDNVHVKLTGGAARFERITLGLLERYDLRLILHVPEISAEGGPQRP
jgi:transcriptional regulator with XRE-family HTH domain